MACVPTTTKAQFFIQHCRLLGDAQAPRLTQGIPSFRQFATCRTPCVEKLIQGRTQWVDCVSFDLLEATVICAACQPGIAGLMGQALFSHFESSIHVALKLPEKHCCCQASTHCRHGSEKKMSFLKTNRVLPVPGGELILPCSIAKGKLNMITSLNVRP